MDQVFKINLLRAQQFVDQAGDKHAVGAGSDADPLIRDGVVASLDRVDRDNLHTLGLQLAERRLQWVRCMIFGDAKQQKVFGPLPVGFAELPKRTTERIETRRRHINRAEPAVRGKIWRTELLRKPAGQSLTLVATREQRQLLGIGLAHVTEPAGGKLKCLIPGNFLVLAGAARTDPQHRAGQAGRRIVLHNPGGALAAQYALVHGVVAIALDIANLTVLQMYFDAAAAGTHVAGGTLDFVGGRH